MVESELTKVARSYVTSGFLSPIFARSSSFFVLATCYTMPILVVLERSRMFTLRSSLLFFCLLTVSQAWVSPQPVAQRPSWTPLEATSSSDDPSSTRTTSFLESSAWLLPPSLGTLAFGTYDTTSTVFHSALDQFGPWTKEQADLIAPVLNGPVALSISILFGTLVAMTIQTLYSRQTTMHQLLMGILDQVERLEVHVRYLPDTSKAKQTLQTDLRSLAQGYVRDVQEGTLSVETIPELEGLLVQCHELLLLTEDEPKTLSHVYSGLDTLTGLQSDLRSALQTVFSTAHYVNLLVLGCTMLLVFLLQVEQLDATFQLGLCWGLLVATYSMLGVIIYDLATPFTGIFRTGKGLEYTDDEVVVKK